MAVYDLEEQDKLEDLKAWWEQWGTTITGVIIALAVGVIAVQGWRWWSMRQAEQGAVLYEAVSSAARANDPAKAKDAMAQLSAKYPGTGYAPRAGLLMAALLFDNGDKAGAKAELAAVIDKSSEDDLKQIARLRLAAILLDDKQYDEALRILDAKHDEPFEGLYADLRGDILAGAGRNDDARKAYQTAMAHLDAKSSYRSFVQIKLDTLGGPVAGADVDGAGTTPPAAPPAAASQSAPPAAPSAAPTPAPAAAAPTPAPPASK
jgi:predicted negative regulator of RcsB-dependent stress response